MKKLSLLLLLTMAGGCNKDPVDELTPNLTNCRIVKETFSTESGRYNNQPETITLEGKPVVIYPQDIKDYSYDLQGQIVREEKET